MLIDEVNIILKAGHGGHGKVAFFPGKKSGPSGGNGGRGGDLYIQTTLDIMVLRRFTAEENTVAAEDGFPGGDNRKIGKDGKDIVVLLPVGSVLKDLNTLEKVELTEPNQKILFCKGGLGGLGNCEFKSSRNTTPTYAQKGLKGEEKHLQISLRLIANFGLIGLPNVGKSSLLNELTKTSVKTANYPFTTLEPNLGVLPPRHFERSEGSVILADIPGLIEGASLGKGLGIKFLKHIEKTSTLLHCISADSLDIESDYNVVSNELKAFSEGLLRKPQIILLTKSDLVTSKDLKEKTTLLKKYKHKVIPVSIHDWDSIENLKNILST